MIKPKLNPFYSMADAAAYLKWHPRTVSASARRIGKKPDAKYLTAEEVGRMEVDFNRSKFERDLRSKGFKLNPNTVPATKKFNREHPTYSKIHSGILTEAWSFFGNGAPYHLILIPTDAEWKKLRELTKRILKEVAKCLRAAKKLASKEGRGGLKTASGPREPKSLAAHQGLIDAITTNDPYSRLGHAFRLDPIFCGVNDENAGIYLEFLRALMRIKDLGERGGAEKGDRTLSADQIDRIPALIKKGLGDTAIAKIFWPEEISQPINAGRPGTIPQNRVKQIWRERTRLCPTSKK